jgi:hypothetical protein
VLVSRNISMESAKNFVPEAHSICTSPVYRRCPLATCSHRAWDAFSHPATRFGDVLAGVVLAAGACGLWASAVPAPARPKRHENRSRPTIPTGVERVNAE